MDYLNEENGRPQPHRDKKTPLLLGYEKTKKNKKKQKKGGKKKLEQLVGEKKGEEMKKGGPTKKPRKHPRSRQFLNSGAESRKDQLLGPTTRNNLVSLHHYRGAPKKSRI